MSEPEEKEGITTEFVIEQVKIAFPWMLKSIKHKAMEINGDNFSDELKHAIAVQELLENV